jgi:tetratricopeptide (TPR) repeat protein
MKMRKIILATSAMAFATAMTLFGVASAQSQGYGQTAPAPNQNQQPAGNSGQGQSGQGQAGQNGQGRGRGPVLDPAEEAAIKSFNTATDSDAKIQAGEAFEQKYPNSRYIDGVRSTLVNLYYGKQDWAKFYAEADTAIGKNADDVPVLTLVGWVIPRVYKADDPTEPAKLDEAEKYEKHALDVIASMQKPAQLTEDQFNQAKASAASEAHSGLGMTYFRKNDFENSAKELQTATAESTEVDPSASARRCPEICKPAASKPRRPLRQLRASPLLAGRPG